MLIADKVLADKIIIQVFEKSYLLAMANRLAIAGLISTNYCLLNIHCLIYARSVVVFTVDAIDYWILHTKQIMLLFFTLRN